jgi:tetratricopeptide (TPR) repeat protein
LPRQRRKRPPPDPRDRPTGRTKQRRSDGAASRNANEARDSAKPVDAADRTSASRPFAPWTWYRGLGKLYRWVVGVMSFLLLVAGFVQLVRSQLPTSDPPPKRMRGLFNVAVAPFHARGGDSDAETSELAGTLALAGYEDLDAVLAKLTRIKTEVWSPDETAAESGESLRLEQLPALAQRINADVLVYGELEVGEKRSALTPRLYVRPGLLRGAEELVGGFQLGSPIARAGNAGTNLGTGDELVKGLRARIAVLAQFVLGLGHMAVGRHAEASKLFEQAASGLEPGAGREVVYLYLGTAAGKRGLLPEAAAAYQRALADRPRYARAQLGLAEVHFQQSRGTCTAASVRVRLLRRAQAEYRSAGNVRGEGGATDIGTKATLGVGRTEVCLAQSGNGGSWERARAHLATVIDSYERGNERLRELASLAYAALAIVDLPREGAASPRDAYLRAIEDLEKAHELTTDPKLEAAYTKAIAIYRRKAGA